MVYLLQVYALVIALVLLPVGLLYSVANLAKLASELVRQARHSKSASEKSLITTP